MNSALEFNQYSYFGICSFLSSENVLARSNLGLAASALNPMQIKGAIENKIQDGHLVIIPSHFWWR